MTVFQTGDECSSTSQWSSAEAKHPIKILELRVLKMALQHWNRLLPGNSIRVLSDNVPAVAYFNHHGGNRRYATSKEASQIM